MQDVAIFWDYENCSPPSNASGYIVANNIRLMAQAYGSIKSLKAYLEITDQVSSPRALALRSEFQTSGVSLIDCPHNNRKEVADKMIIVDMLAYAIDNPAPSVIVLISGDRDFAYALSILRLRHYHVVLVTLSNAHPSLTSQASECYDWHSEIICPVIQPTGPRTASNPIPTVTRTSSHRDSLIGQPSPSQSSQAAQETESNGERIDHGDLLHYLRSVTQTGTRRRADSTSYNTNSRQKGRYEHPRQDVSTPVEVDVELRRPSLSDKSTGTDTTYFSTSEEFPLAIQRNPPGPLQQRSLPPAYEHKALMTVPTIAQPQPCFSLSDKLRSLSTSSPKIDDSTPPILLHPEAPQNSPMGRYVATEDDVPTSDFAFFYPMRLASAPHSLPSQSPLVSTIEPAESEIAAELPELSAAEALSALQGSSTHEESQQTPPILQETYENPICSAAHSSDLSEAAAPVAISEETPNSDLLCSDMNSADSSNQTIVASNSYINQVPVTTGLVNQPGFSTTDSQKAVQVEDSDPLPPINQARTSEPNTQTGTADDLNPSSDLSSATDNKLTPAIVVPPIFKILVETLKSQKSKGFHRPLRSFVAETMYRNGFTYDNTGVTTFSQYIALAEKQGIVEVGGATGGEWVSLKPQYDDTFKPATPVVPPIFKMLVQTLKLQQSKGFPRASRAIVAYTMYRSGFVYKDVGVNKFGQYAALAEKQGIVELGGTEGEEWITLAPMYRNIPMSQVS